MEAYFLQYSQIVYIYFVSRGSSCDANLRISLQRQFITRLQNDQMRWGWNVKRWNMFRPDSLKKNWLLPTDARLSLQVDQFPITSLVVEVLINHSSYPQPLLVWAISKLYYPRVFVYLCICSRHMSVAVALHLVHCGRGDAWSMCPAPYTSHWLTYNKQKKLLFTFGSWMI